MVQRIKSFDCEKAMLYIVATPIGNLSEMSDRAKQVLAHVDVVACEDTRTSGKLLKHFGIDKKLIAYHKHNEAQSALGILSLIEGGKSVALCSDAGYPLLSDPGSYLIQLLKKKAIAISCVAGSNAMLQALVCSGFAMQHFLFYGFLAATENKRVKELQALTTFPYTILFYEAPHRLKKMLHSLHQVLGNREVCIARELSKLHEEFIHGNLLELLELDEGLKGEMVVIVEGVHAEESVAKTELLQAINKCLKQGISTSEAIKKVAKKYGVAKNKLYQMVHHD